MQQYSRELGKNQKITNQTNGAFPWRLHLHQERRLGKGGSDRKFLGWIDALFQVQTNKFGLRWCKRQPWLILIDWPYYLFQKPYKVRQLHGYIKVSNTKENLPSQYKSLCLVDLFVYFATPIWKEASIKSYLTLTWGWTLWISRYISR